MQIADLKCFYLYKVMNKCWWDVFFIPPRDVLYNYFSFVHFGVTQQPSGTFRNKPPITTDRNENSKLKTHSVWKSQKKSHSTLRAKRATFTIWMDKSSLKMPKIVQFGEFLKTEDCNQTVFSVTRQVNFWKVKNAKNQIMHYVYLAVEQCYQKVYK